MPAASNGTRKETRQGTSCMTTMQKTLQLFSCRRKKIPVKGEEKKRKRQAAFAALEKPSHSTT